MPSVRDRLDPKRLYSLRELQRYVGLAWTTVQLYAREASMREHRVVVPGRRHPKWKPSAAAELLRIYKRRMARRGRPRRRGRPPVREFGEPASRFKTDE